ncbi:ADP-ribosylation factor-like protein 9 [Diretmus argenteus]
MSAFRDVGLLAASVALAGGLAYVIWTYASSSSSSSAGEKKKESKTKPERGCKADREEERGEATEAQKTSEFKPVEKGKQVLVLGVTRPVATGKQVLVLGLDGAGKTSLLHCFTTSGLEQDVVPTPGFNAVSINRGELQIEFLEIGGKENLRPYWQKYMSKALVLVFVVDSSDADRFPLAKKHLHELLASDSRLPLVVLANKQDRPGACSITDLHDNLSLSEAGDRRQMFLIGTHVKKGDAQLSSGVQDARDLIIQMVSVKTAMITPRLLQLSNPKLNHPDFHSNRHSAVSLVSCASRAARTSPRLDRLALPRLKESNVCYELGRPEESIWTVRASESPLSG